MKTEHAFEKISSRSLADEMENNQIVAVIGSRSVKDRPDTCSVIWNFSNAIRKEKSCQIVSGGAYGSDQAGMEGALGLKLHALDPVIPVSSRNVKKFVDFVKEMIDQDIEWDEKECAVKTKRMILLYPDFSDGYHPSKYHERNQKIVNASEIVIAFWDGVSKGTKATFGYAVKMEKQTIIIKI